MQLVRSWLNSTDKRWLLLCDNADETEPRRLRHFLPQNPKGRILITSRNPHWQSLGSVLRLDVFTPDEAAAFWREKLGAGDETKRAELAAELGFLPLALEQAAAYMAENSESRSLPGAVPGAATSVVARYASTRRLPRHHYHHLEHQLCPGAANPGRRRPAQPMLLFSARRHPAGAADRPRRGAAPDLAAVLPDDLARNKALHALTGYSLLTRQDGTVTIHRLVQTVARDQMKTELAQTWVEAAVDLLRKAYRYDPHDMNTWPMCAELLPHLRITTELADEREIHTNHAAFLNNEAGFYLNQNGQYTAARPFYERALAIREQALGPDHPDTAQSLNNLGALHSAMGNLSEARPFYERALAIREQALGSDHPDTARSLNNLGALHRAMGNLSEARPFYERALAINEQALGPDHPDTARSLNNLGYLHRAMGNLSDARPFYERALAITEQALGPDHPDTARSLNNLGSLLQDMGNLSEARPFYERALAIREQALGPDHPDTALSLNNLAVLSYYENDKAEAAHLMQRALIIWEAALGSDHPDTQSSRQSLSIIQSELNS
ncbi:MAG: tetratricopeptide repeat protein [Chloroflexi bacterium]|nr:tetratricopeptide repeat protein [Chloroflexota bacterium]